MSVKTFTVEVQPDFLEREAEAKPVQAVAELIWNSADADATQIDVRIEQNAIGMTGIVVTDNGLGIPYHQAPALFTRLGGSWKKPGGRTTMRGRVLHGHEGRGRFKTFALGRVADWHVTY
jgi:Histidine kinase-, DNA gyrase B-, and HSP90-like ATPase